MTTLSRSEWQERAATHTERIDTLIGPYLAERRRGIAHPVIDFLFTYYSARPAQLTRWHPGYGVALAEAPEYLALTAYAATDTGAATVRSELVERRHRSLVAILALVEATAARPPRFGCFGLHEWAMVYRDSDTRHHLPLRLGPRGTDDVVESLLLRCTHYDAFRFFTPEAIGRNTVALSRAMQLDYEQPGCLHAGMDLYRHALKLGPLSDGELLADCFALALDARILDMQASPYDLTGLGYAPIPVETPEGRAEYIRGQTALTDRAAALRERLAATCRDLLHTRETCAYREVAAE